MIILTSGYFAMGIAFLILRVFYYIFYSTENVFSGIKNDFKNLYDYAKRKSKKLKAVIVIAAVMIVISISPYSNDITVMRIEDVFSFALFFLLANIFLPSKNPEQKNFPFEIFRFIYSVIFMFFSAGTLVYKTFYLNEFFKEDIWIFGYIITVFSYVICVTALNRFMERALSTVNIILLGMIMLTTLEFITYYGIGFFNGLEQFKYSTEISLSNIFGDITAIINQEIYIASQSQILDRAPIEIWDYIILNGTDVLTVTVVLGYVVQKFFVNSST